MRTFTIVTLAIVALALCYVAVDAAESLPSNSVTPLQPRFMEKQHRGGKAHRKPSRHHTHETTEDVLEEANEETHEHEDGEGNVHHTTTEDARHEIDEQTEELEHEMNPDQKHDDSEEDEDAPQEDGEDEEERDEIEAEKSKNGNPMDETLAEAEKENQKAEAPALSASQLGNGGHLPEAILPGEAPPTNLTDKEVDVIARLVLKEKAKDCDKECARRKEAKEQAKKDCAALNGGDSCAFTRKDRPYDKVAKDRADAPAAPAEVPSDSDIAKEDAAEKTEVGDALKKAEEASA